MTDDWQTYDDLFERLDGDGRINPIPERVMDVQSREALAEARDLVNHAINQGITTGAELARRSGFKPGVISNFINDKWGKRRAALELSVASDLSKIINAIIKEREAEKTKVGGFISIRLTEAIFAIVQYAIKRKKIAAFVVPAGSGKTMALEALKLEVPGAVMITVKRTRSTVKSFLQLWARSLGLNETGRSEDIQDRIAAALKGSHRVMLIDEGHKLSVAAIDTLREIWDEVQIPIILAGTPSLYQTLTSQRVGTYASELMDQLYSRVGMFRDLTTLENSGTGQSEDRFTVEDLRRIYVRGRVRIARDGLTFLCKLANTPGAGGLRACSDLVQIVTDLYAGEVMTAALLRAALATRLGIKEAGFIPPEADVASESIAATA